MQLQSLGHTKLYDCSIALTTVHQDKLSPTMGIARVGKDRYLEDAKFAQSQQASNDGDLLIGSLA